jgi:hypothetical protein
MKLVDPRFPMTISDQAVNAITENPFKYPRPDNVKGKLFTGEGENRTVKPNVAFTGAMEYLYRECIKHMLRKFRQNMTETFERLHKNSTGDYDLASFKCGTSQLKRSIYLYPWDIQCMIIPLNPDLKVEDIDIMAANIIPEDLSKYFYLELVAAEFKHRAKNQPLQVKGTALNTQRTKP